MAAVVAIMMREGKREIANPKDGLSGIIANEQELVTERMENLQMIIKPIFRY